MTRLYRRLNRFTSIGRADRIRAFRGRPFCRLRDGMCRPDGRFTVTKEMKTNEKGEVDND